MKEVVISGASRTPMGGFQGVFQGAISGEIPEGDSRVHSRVFRSLRGACAGFDVGMAVRGPR